MDLTALTSDVIGPRHNLGNTAVNVLMVLTFTTKLRSLAQIVPLNSGSLYLTTIMHISKASHVSEQSHKTLLLVLLVSEKSITFYMIRQV